MDKSMTQEEFLTGFCSLKVSNQSLDKTGCIDWAASDSSGGTCVFIGTVRDMTAGKPVKHLEFEAYVPMALKEMEGICLRIHEQWPVHKVLIHHATGTLLPGHVPVVIVVSAAHRAAAFEACQFAIDTLKETVPIWKKEVFEDGETWVSAHP